MTAARKRKSPGLAAEGKGKGDSAQASGWGVWGWQMVQLIWLHKRFDFDGVAATWILWLFKDYGQSRGGDVRMVLLAPPRLDSPEKLRAKTIVQERVCICIKSIVQEELHTT